MGSSTAALQIQKELLFHIDPNNGDESSNKIADFFEKCKTDAEYWNKMSAAGLQRIYECYTLKIYANKVLNMDLFMDFGGTRTRNRKLAKQRYIEAFYNLQFNNLAKNVPIPEFASSTQTSSTSKTKPQETTPTAVVESQHSLSNPGSQTQIRGGPIPSA
ncbi:hypothetical protein NC652_029232 [Populus alba x Populus x berolinensis]|nr:hypothetical protein NC652_029232 [Populus alba x Populus x berolinensis]